MVTRAGTFYYGTDLQGSVYAMWIASGQVMNSYSYAPFGETLTATEAWANPLRYAGRELDTSTGLYYNNARWYDPALHRFISEDPIGIEGGSNLYAYTANDPVNYVDPSGLTLQDPDCYVTIRFQYDPQTGYMIPGTVTILGFTAACSAPPRGDPAERGRGHGGRGGEGRQQASRINECGAMAAVAGAIAKHSSTVAQFTDAFAFAVAGVDGVRSAASGGHNRIPTGPGGANFGGFRPDLGGSEPHNPRHFAGSLWARQHLVDAYDLAFWHEAIPGGTEEDRQLSYVAFQLWDGLHSGSTPLENVQQWIQINVCAH